MSAWLIVGGLVIGTVWASRYFANWMGLPKDFARRTNWDGEDRFLSGMMCFLVLVISACTWPVVIPIGFLQQFFKRHPIHVRLGIGKYLQAFYTLDRQERKKVLAK